MMLVYEENKAFLFAYTEIPCPGSYPEELAYSVHFACSRDGIHFEALHNGYGILFAEGLVDELDRIVPRGVRDVRVFALPEGGYGIGARRVNRDGSREEDAERWLLWKTKDFCAFEDPEVIWRSDGKSFASDGVGFVSDGVGFVSGGTAFAFEECGFEAAANSAAQTCCMVEGEERQGSLLLIPSDVCDRMVRRWNPIRNTQVQLPKHLTVGSKEELMAITARAVYSDGSSAPKKVHWHVEEIDFSEEGTHVVKGSVLNRTFSFPLARGYGDPVIFSWEGKWYFLSTSDNRHDIGIYIREAETVEGLFADGIQEHLLLGLDEERGFLQTFWAPEFHVIGGKAYILFAVSGKEWGPQCHLMKHREGKSLTGADGWEAPVRVVRRDQSPLSQDGITLDMTCLRAGNRSYMVWSYRRHIFTLLDTGSMLMIAEADEEKPWQLAGEPVLLSRPLYGWENVDGTINNEGPHAFIREGKVYLTYSGGAANGYTYALGLLTAMEKENLTDVSVWKKSNAPVLTFRSVEGEYGPGHNSFYVDEDNNLMIAYHGETEPDSTLRCDGIRRVHFDIQGEPVFDLSAERDLDPALAEVSVQVRVKPVETLQSGKAC